MAVVRRKRNRPAMPARRVAIGHGANNSRDARNLYEQMGFGNHGGHIEQFIEKLGIRLVRKPMSDDQSGFLHPEGSRWVIGVNSLHHPNRQKFTMAHELGHYFLHRHKSKAYDDSYAFTRADAKSDPDEWQANQFAAEFLMPTNEFRDRVAKGYNSFDQLASYFGVSTMAVRIRAKTLGMTGHGL